MASSSSTNTQYDYTSGQDAAHKLGQEQSSLASGQMASLYSADVAGALASISRIRDIQDYLRRGGYSDMEVIPRARMASQSHSTSLSD